MHLMKVNFSEPINIDNDDFDSFTQRHPNNTFRKRGRPRTTNKIVGQKLPQTIPQDSFQKTNLSPKRTILHDAVDIFLKPNDSVSMDRSSKKKIGKKFSFLAASPTSRKRVNRKSKNLENEQLLSKINTLAEAIKMTSPKHSDLVSPTNSNRLQSPDLDQLDETAKSKKTKAKFDLKAPENQTLIEKLRNEHSELKEMSDLEVCGIHAIMNAISDQQVI